MITGLYNEVWPELAIQATAETPKGGAIHAGLHPYGGANGFCTVTGEPMHDEGDTELETNEEPTDEAGQAQ